MTLGKFLISVGLLLMASGIVVVLLDRAGIRPWSALGRLPGDVRWQGGGVRVVFPIVTCVVVSLVLSLVLHGWRR